MNSSFVQITFPLCIHKNELQFLAPASSFCYQIQQHTVNAVGEVPGGGCRAGPNSLPCNTKINGKKTVEAAEHGEIKRYSECLNKKKNPVAVKKTHCKEG